jgi:hypothetical protein
VLTHESRQLPSWLIFDVAIIMTQLRRITIFADDAGDSPSDDYLWVRAWLDRWNSKIQIAHYSSGGWEHLWDLEGPEEAIAELPTHLLCCSEWASPEIFRARPPAKKRGRA